MLVKQKLYKPLILTIPDDAAFFSILNPNEKIASKIIMENYIDFYCFKNPIYNLVYFRFKNDLDCGSIDGIKHCFIPIEIMKKHCNDLTVILQLLMDGYVLTMPVDRKSIDFYKNSEGNHLLLIYGVDTSRQILFCKDFLHRLFVEFEVSFEAMKNSLANCDTTNLQASDGLLAFQIDDKASAQIEYSKVYSEFHKLKAEYTSADAGYGLGAVDLYINGVIQYPCEVDAVDRWYVIANYLREAAKLMKIRYYILEKELCKRQIEKSGNEILIQNLLHDTDILFFTTSKLQQKKNVASSEIVKKLNTLTNTCRKDFYLLADYFCESICKTMYLS